MNVSCPDCRSVFRVDPAKVPAAGVDVRCNVCGAVFAVAPAQDRSDAILVQNETFSSASVVAESSPVMNPAVSEPQTDGEPIIATARERDPESVATPAPSAPASHAPIPPPSGSLRSTAEVRAGGDAELAGSGRAENASSPRDSAVPGPSVAAPAESRPRPVNPYLNNSPELRARRLARALVSDLVAYNPQKREQGLRDGTLRQLFRDEIRKSWEEYVEQVGANVAENTPHFQDALNDVLAGGRRVF